jgi:hypothetical protein
VIPTVEWLEHEGFLSYAREFRSLSDHSFPDAILTLRGLTLLGYRFAGDPNESLYERAGRVIKDSTWEIVKGTLVSTGKSGATQLLNSAMSAIVRGAGV